MKTDIEIAQEAVMEPITKVAESIGIEADDLELYGKYKAKLSEEFLRKIQDRPNGKLILVTAINPTPAGEGKTTTTVGMGEAFGRMGKKAVIALREPSLGPCFGIKGGAAGGGYAQVVPMDELNLHFTGANVCSICSYPVMLFSFFLMAVPVFQQISGRRNFHDQSNCYRHRRRHHDNQYLIFPLPYTVTCHIWRCIPAPIRNSFFFQPDGDHLMPEIQIIGKFAKK